jgi:transcriptional regulator with AAA-type ATPase domain
MRAENHEALRRLDWIMIGGSAPMRQLRAQITSAASGPDAVLLRARSDCGAEAIARAIHAASPRSRAPFISVDGSRLNASRREGEISPFSTGGVQPSRLELADGGVLFIDHFERLPSYALEQLAGFIEATQAARLANRTPAPDVQLIAVTSLPDGILFPPTFPAPVVDTLQMQQIRVPSLAERRDDIVTLAEAILQRQVQASGRTLDGFDAESISRMRAHPWPGNLRELEDVVVRASAGSTTGVVTIDPALIQSGVRVGGYRLMRRLGAGGFGEVWEARHQLLARPAAVKLMRGDHANDLELLERFRREAAATASLASQHTVILYDFGISEQGQFYHVMELLDGLDLDRLCERHGPPAPERLARFLLHACRSLAEAHARGMIHRDIKPSNLFTCRLGLEVDVLKVLDFGLVRRTDVPQRRLTQENFVVGTPDYMAPEAAADDGRIESRTDIYSLAASAWAMSAGRSLFTAEAPMAVLVAHVHQAPEHLLTCAPHIPKVLADLIMAGLAKNPADRPTASELGRALIATGLPQAWNERLRRQWWDEHRPLTRPPAG